MRVSEDFRSASCCRAAQLIDTTPTAGATVAAGTGSGLDGHGRTQSPVLRKRSGDKWGGSGHPEITKSVKTSEELMNDLSNEHIRNSAVLIITLEMELRVIMVLRGSVRPAWGFP